MKNLTTGMKAPSFKLKDEEGHTVELKTFKNKSAVIIYFYPKALTPGCTLQSCHLRDHYKKLKKMGYEVFGISGDDEQKLLKFKLKEKLNFPLLSDPGHKICKKYGSFGLKKFMGKEYEGILRKTFVVDLEGKIILILDPVNTKTHHQVLLENLGSL